ncbi:MAG TPA: HlyD family efflux transporter periplasmic adaptor subunit [Thermoanaerobaculia bacterium]
MRDAVVLDLADCTEFRQTLQARPPRIVHGTAALLVALLGTAVAWSALTRANLVVRAPGRVRPVTTPEKVFNAARGEVLGAGAGGRVVAVHVREGDVVRRGDLLIRLETERLDHEIARKRRMLRAAEEELETLVRQEALTTHQFESIRAKTRAELEQAREQVHRAREQQNAEVRLLQVELDLANDEEVQLRMLVGRQAAPKADLLKAVRKVREVQEKLAKARLPVDESPLPVAERALDLAERDAAVKREERELKRTAKRAEIEVARIELASLELEGKLAEIRAPRDGIVTQGDVKVGDVLEPGKSVLELAPQGGFLFEATVPSAEVGHLGIGMAARIKLDAYDYQRYGTVSGRVCFLSPDSGVEKENRTATYTVRILLDRDTLGRGESRGRVKLGMAGLADIVTGRESLLSLLVRRIRQTISLG